MANKRRRETQEKRRREHDKQTRQASKEADRRERNAKKKADTLAGVVTAPLFLTVSDIIGDPEQESRPTDKETP